MKRTSLSRSLTLALALGVLALVAACSESDSREHSAGSSELHRSAPTGSADPRVGPVDGEVIRGGTDYDYDVASSVAGAARNAEVAAVGTVASWSEGRLVRDGDELIKHAILEMKVTSTFASSNPVDTIFIEIQRGGTLVDDHGREVQLSDGSRYNERSVSDLRTAAPVGTRLILLGLAAPSEDKISGEVVRRSKAAKAGAAIFSPIPQGLLFEDAEGRYVSGVADQADVEIEQWPAAAENSSADLFQQLVDQLSEEFGHHQANSSD